MEDEKKARVMEKVGELFKGLAATTLKALRFDRKNKRYEELEQIVIHVKGDTKTVEEVRKMLSIKGILFEGEFDNLPPEERQRLYDEARQKALKWYEVECEECGRFVNVFEKKFFKVYEYKFHPEETYCEYCREEKRYAPDEEITDQLRAECVKRGKPRYKLVRLSDGEEIAITLVGDERHLFSERMGKLTFQALKEWGKPIG